MSTLFMVCSDCAAMYGYLDVNSVVSEVSNPKPILWAHLVGVASGLRSYRMACRMRLILTLASASFSILPLVIMPRSLRSSAPRIVNQCMRYIA